MMASDQTTNGDAGNGWAAAQKEWDDPSNWHGGFLSIYVAPRDPRLWVRKRYYPMGWTFNYAHRASWYVTGAMVAAALAVMTIVVWLDR
jgi:uncharacterized membrane protein